MNTLFALLAFFSFLAIPVCLLGVVYAFVRKKRKKPFVRGMAVAFVIMILSAVVFSVTRTPEQIAADEARAEQRRIANELEEAQEAQKKAAEQAIKAQQEQDEKAAKEAEEAQKKADEAAAKAQEEAEEAKENAEPGFFARLGSSLGSLFSSSSENNIPDQICATAGIGDTSKSWEDDHGTPNRDNDSMKNYKNDRFIVVFNEDRAFNITYQSDNGKKDKVLNSMIPTDAVEISKENDTSDAMTSKHKTVYHSDLIAKVVAGSDGTITVIDVFDNASGKYISTTIGL